MRILLVVETLKIGGAERFAVELASELSKKNEVFLFFFYPEKVDEGLWRKIPTTVVIRHPNKVLFFFIDFIEKVLAKLNFSFSLLNLFLVRQVKNFIKERQIQIVHSNQFNVDFVCAKAISQMPRNIPLVCTIHGDYISFFNIIKGGGRIYRNTDFLVKLKFVLQRINTIVCISDNQLDFFNKLPNEFTIPNLLKIYNGVSVPKIDLDKKDVGAYAGFTFGMVARGIPEKGWLYAIDAFKALKLKNCRLILVGWSDYLEALSQSEMDDRIIFVGQVDEPYRYISQFDVGLLPSVYSSESLPTSVIEYLMCGKPVIATDVGEIRKMITTEAEMAGAVISPHNIVNELISEMQRMYDDRDYFEKCKVWADMAALKFRMADCGQRYYNVYSHLLKAAE